MMEEFASESDSDYTSYWRDWVSLWRSSFSLLFFLGLNWSIIPPFGIVFTCVLFRAGLGINHRLARPRRRRIQTATLFSCSVPCGTCKTLPLQTAPLALTPASILADFDCTESNVSKYTISGHTYLPANLYI